MVVGIEASKWNLETVTHIGYPKTLDEEKNKSLLLYFPWYNFSKESQLHNTRLYDLHWRVYSHLKILQSAMIFHLHFMNLFF